MNLGMTEILLILGIALLLFGPSKLPALGKSMGEAIRGFKGALNTSDEKPVLPKPNDESDAKKQTVKDSEQA